MCILCIPDIADSDILYASAIAATKSENLVDPLLVSIPIQALYRGA